MSGTVATRVGLGEWVATRTRLTTSGLRALTYRDVRAWLTVVRDGGLTTEQARATLLLVYRVWLVAFTLKAVGSGWDVSWHFRQLRDDFAPPHDINLVGDGMAIVLVICHWYTRFGVDKLALRLMTIGVTLFVVSAPIDVINHRINGLDITSWSITHFGLYTGTAIMIAGVIRGWRISSGGLSARDFTLGALWFFFLENVMFPAQQQEYGVLAIRNFLAGHPTAVQDLLDFAQHQAKVKVLDAATFESFALPIPSWVYPLWLITAAMLVLVAARFSVGLRWTATTVAVAYVGWRCVLWPILSAAGFPRSTVPFLILFGAIAIDLIFLTRVPWLAQAIGGAMVVAAAVCLGGYVESHVLAAPPINYAVAPIAAVILAAGWGGLAYLKARRDTVLF